MQKFSRTPFLKTCTSSALNFIFNFFIPLAVSMDSPIRRMTTLNDLKLTIRCLSLTTWYFVSQIAIFLPGIIYFGCDMETDVRNEIFKKQIYHLVINNQSISFQSEHDLLNTCGNILNLEVRVFIFLFYQLQFLKPFFFLLFDKELRRGLGNLVRCEDATAYDL